MSGQGRQPSARSAPDGVDSIRAECVECGDSTRVWTLRQLDGFESYHREKCGGDVLVEGTVQALGDALTE